MRLECPCRQASGCQGSISTHLTHNECSRYVSLYGRFLWDFWVSLFGESFVVAKAMPAGTACVATI